ncbi:unnamed protein product [Ilex paraguariensis]|uniref:Dynamin GTPase domain-containing protein n=1 Tax=Ilex paraguariensis TaxID=185542 RepID=A0ABC8U769_9AQUA
MNALLWSETSDILHSLCGRSECHLGQDFLPRGSGIVTRQPLVLLLQRFDEGTEYVEFSHAPRKSVSQCSASPIYSLYGSYASEIADETDRETGSTKQISSVPIYLSIYTPNGDIDLVLIFVLQSNCLCVENSLLNGIFLHELLSAVQPQVVNRSHVTKGEKGTVSTKVDSTWFNCCTLVASPSFTDVKSFANSIYRLLLPLDGAHAAFCEKVAAAMSKVFNNALKQVLQRSVLQDFVAYPQSKGSQLNKRVKKYQSSSDGVAPDHRPTNAYTRVTRVVCVIVHHLACTSSFNAF